MFVLRLTALVAALALPLVQAATPNLPPPPANAHVTPGGLAVLPAQGSALQVPAGFISWEMLSRVTPVKQGNTFVPGFSKDIEALNGKEVKLQGFMMPMEMGEKQANFILSATTPTCAFCMPGGPDQVVEVRAAKGIKYTMDAVSVTGRFVVMKNDPMGLYYRLEGAKAIK